MKNISFKSLFLILIFLSLMSRIIAFYFFADTELVNEWRILVHNLSIKGVLGFNVVTENYLAVPKLAEKSDVILPSVFMPPFYAYYIFFIKLLSFNIINYINLLIISQIVISIFTIYIFFKMIRLTETNHKSFLFTFIFALVPINIYSSVQISSVCIQVFFLVCFFYILKLYSIKKFLDFKYIFFLSSISGLLILLRGEFIIFYFFTIIYFFLYNSRKYKFFFISLIITSLIISPYIIRNYLNFNTFVITKSLGYNLLKGNNPKFKVEGNPDFIELNYDKKELNIKADNFYEIKLDDFYKARALEFIKNDYLYHLKNYLTKVMSFIFFDFNSSYENYYNYFHLIPKIFLSIISFLGGLLVVKKKGFLQYISIYFFMNIFFFSIFFILPRYSLILLPIQILLGLEFVKFCLRKFSNKFFNNF